MILNQRANVRPGGREEARLAKRRNEADHRAGIEVAVGLQAIDDQLADRLRAVHPLHQLGFPRLELEVHPVIRPGGDRVVVAPPQAERLHLGAGGQQWDERLRVHTVLERFPQVDPARRRGVRDHDGSGGGRRGARQRGCDDRPDGNDPTKGAPLPDRVDGDDAPRDRDRAQDQEPHCPSPGTLCRGHSCRRMPRMANRSGPPGAG